MTGCPPRDHLLKFLSSELSADDEGALAAHLEICANCVQELEQLTSGRADSGVKSPGSTVEQPGTTHIHKAEQPSGLSGEELVRLRGMLPDRRHGWITPPKTDDSGFPDVPGYRIDAEIGRGGMGVVYRARQLQLNRPVALKMILNSQFATQEQVVRFLTEAQTCAAIRHPGIVQIFEVGQHASVPFYSMELLEDGTLAEYVAKHTVVPRDAAALIEDVARAIHAAHLHGVVHRDLKPANILLQNVEPGKSRISGRTASGRPPNGGTSMLRTQASPLAPKITDFGLARRFDLETGLTHTGALLGTPDYMAPEQVEPGKHHVGPAVDVYSLGAMLYFLLTGQPPFASTSVMETLEAVKNRDATPPSRINAAIPHDLSIICLHCLNKHPNHRYATAEQLADDLSRFLNGQPISARPVSDLERLRKWVRRNPGVAVLTGSLLATILIALTLVTWQWTRAVDARNRESQRADSEALARQAEASARRESQMVSATYSLEHGIRSCREGKSRDGLLSMVRALELLPEGETELEFAIRANIDGWRRQVCATEFRNSRGTPYTSIAFSPDGQLAAVGDWGNDHGKIGPAEIKLLDVNDWSGEPIWKVSHPAAVWSVAFSPDGQRIAIGGFDATSVVLDAATGNAVFSPLPHAGRVYSVAFSPDGKTLAVGGHVGNKLMPDHDVLRAVGDSGELRLFDAATGSIIGEPHAFPFRINCLAWHPSGQSIVLGGLNVAIEGQGAAGVAAIFDVAARTLTETKLIHPDGVGAVAFSPDASRLMTGCRDGLIRSWDLATGNVDAAPQFQTRTINGLAFAKDAHLLAVASGHHEPGMRVGIGEVHLWNPVTRTHVMELPFERIRANSQKMHAVAFGDNDRKVAAVSEHGRAWLWTLPKPVTPVREWKFSQRSDVYHNPDGKRLLLNVLPPNERGFGEQPCEFHLIDSEDGHTIAVLPHSTVSWARFSPDNRLFATWGNTSDTISSAVGLWDARTGTAISLPADFPSFLKTVHFTANGAVIQTVSLEGQFRSWNATTLQPFGAATQCCDVSDVVNAINPAGTRAIVSSSSGTRLIQIPDGKVIARMSPDFCHGGGFTNDGATAFASFSVAGSPASRWNAIDGSPRTDPVAKSQRYAMAWHGHGSWIGIDLAAESFPRATDDYSPLIHDQRVSLHPSGLYYATIEGGASDEIHFWSHTGKPIGPPIPHGRLHQVQFNPDGRSLITCSQDGSVKQWALPETEARTLIELQALFQQQARRQM